VRELTTEEINFVGGARPAAQGQMTDLQCGAMGAGLGLTGVLGAGIAGFFIGGPVGALVGIVGGAALGTAGGTAGMLCMEMNNDLTKKRG